MPVEQFLRAADGFLLHTTVYAAKGTCQSVVLIASALGVRQIYYAKFAEFLAENGHTVYSFDYRGMGKSKPQNQSIRGFRADIRDWANKDANAMIGKIEQDYPGLPIHWIGHSLGGQILGFVPKAEGLTKALFVVAQSGYWRNWKGIARLAMWLNWHIVLPSVTNLVGYLPTKELGIFESIPKAASLQWARWGRHRDYLFSEANSANSLYHKLELPILAYSFSDDLYTPKVSVEAYLKKLPRAKIIHRHIDPKPIGIEPVGHFGFFRSKFKQQFWLPALSWLQDED